jgi:predicted dehydrogenase
VFTDLPQALATEPDGVIVSTPTSHHLRVAVPAAQAGCHLFIEKPLSHSWDGVEDLLASVREQGLVTLVGFDLRFDPGLRRVRALLEEKRVGHVVAIQAQVGQYLPDWHPEKDYRGEGSAQPEMGGGVILDLIHELDYVTWLLGPVSRVACFADKLSGLEIQTEDTAAILLEFESRAIGTVHLDYVQRAPSRCCRIIGEEGTILWDHFAHTVRWYEAGQGRWQVFRYDDHDRNDRFLSEMRHLLECMRGEAEPTVDVFAASRVLKLALAAKESSVSGKACQPLP